MDQGREFHSNSHRSRREPSEPVEEKKIEVVVAGNTAIVRKKSLGRRMRDMFVGGDTDSVMSYLLSDVIIPQIKDLLTDAVTQGIEQMIHGTGRSSPRRGSRPGGSSNYTNYNRYSRPGGTPASRVSDRQPATVRGHRVDDVILKDRLDAQNVLDELIRTADKYTVVTVADLYSSVEWSSSHTDTKWGWELDDLDDVRVRRVREGYLLELPQPNYLD